MKFTHCLYSSFEEALEQTSGMPFKVITQYPEEDIHVTSMDFSLEELEDVMIPDEEEKRSLLDKALSYLALAHAEYLEETALATVLNDPITENDPQCLKDAQDAVESLAIPYSEYSELAQDEEFTASYPDAAFYLKESLKNGGLGTAKGLKDLLAKTYSTGVNNGIEEQRKNEYMALQKEKPEMTTLNYRQGLDKPPYMKVEISKETPFEEAIADLMYSGVYGEYETPDCSDALAYMYKVGKVFMPQIESDMIMRECTD